jgi:hypothetical protein
MSDMTPQSPSEGHRGDWQAAFALRYPMARSVGFECFGGWQPILARLFDRLEASITVLPADSSAAFHIVQIKQKFGRLSVQLSTEGTAEMQAVVRDAEESSLVTCEVCAAPGRLAERNAWWSVRCAGHENWSRLV